MRGVGNVSGAWEYQHPHTACCAIGHKMHLETLLHGLFNATRVTLYFLFSLLNLVANVRRGAELKVVGVGDDIYSAESEWMRWRPSLPQDRGALATVWRE